MKRSSNDSRSATYFRIGFFFLVMMAFLWSVDTSIGYILLGVASFLFFLGFYLKPPDTKSAVNNEKSFDQQNEWFSFSKFFEGIRSNVLQSGKTYGTSGNRFVLSGAVRKVYTGVTIFFLLTIIAPIVISIYGEEGRPSNAVEYFTTAGQWHQLQGYDSAYVYYRRALAVDPDYAEALVGYGNLLIDQNKKDSAMLMFDNALKIDPAYKEALYSKAFLFYDQEKYRDAISLLTPVAFDNPEYYDAMLLLADSYYAQKGYNEALVWYEQVYQEGGYRSSMLCQMIAYIYDLNEEYDKAITLYQEALSYDSTIVDIYQRLGEIIPDDRGDFYRSQAILRKQ